VDSDSYEEEPNEKLPSTNANARSASNSAQKNSAKRQFWYIRATLILRKYGNEVG